MTKEQPTGATSKAVVPAAPASPASPASPAAPASASGGMPWKWIGFAFILLVIIILMYDGGSYVKQCVGLGCSNSADKFADWTSTT